MKTAPRTAHNDTTTTLLHSNHRHQPRPLPQFCCRHHRGCLVILCSSREQDPRKIWREICWMQRSVPEENNAHIFSFCHSIWHFCHVIRYSILPHRIHQAMYTTPKPPTPAPHTPKGFQTSDIVEIDVIRPYLLPKGSPAGTTGRVNRLANRTLLFTHTRTRAHTHTHTHARTDAPLSLLG